MGITGDDLAHADAPNLDELTGNNPNVLQDGMDLPSLDLVPERSVAYDVGVKTNFDQASWCMSRTT